MSSLLPRPTRNAHFSARAALTAASSPLIADRRCPNPNLWKSVKSVDENVFSPSGAHSLLLSASCASSKITPSLPSSFVPWIV